MKTGQKKLQSWLLPGSIALPLSFTYVFYESLRSQCNESYKYNGVRVLHLLHSYTPKEMEVVVRRMETHGGLYCALWVHIFTLRPEQEPKLYETTVVLIFVSTSAQFVCQVYFLLLHTHYYCTVQWNGIGLPKRGWPTTKYCSWMHPM